MSPNTQPVVIYADTTYCSCYDPQKWNGSVLILLIVDLFCVGWTHYICLKQSQSSAVRKHLSEKSVSAVAYGSYSLVVTILLEVFPLSPAIYLSIKLPVHVLTTACFFVMLASQVMPRNGMAKEQGEMSVISQPDTRVNLPTEVHRMSAEKKKVSFVFLYLFWCCVLWIVMSTFCLSSA
jgi:hypothetical protein